jgi:hypothetical protein
VQRSIGRNRDSTNLNGSKICGNKFWAIRQQQQNTLFFLDAQFAETVPYAVDVRSDLIERDFHITADYGGLVPTPLCNMSIDKMCRQIVLVWQSNHIQF